MAVYKDKKTKTWFVKRSWYDAHKKRHYITRRGFKTKREAEKVNVKLAAQVNDGIDVTQEILFLLTTIMNGSKLTKKIRLHLIP